MATLSAQERAGAFTHVHDSSGRAQVSNLLFRLAKGKVSLNQVADARHRAYLQTVLALPFADDAEKKTFLNWLSGFVREQPSSFPGTACLRELYFFWQYATPDAGRFPFALLAWESSELEPTRFAQLLEAVQAASGIPFSQEDWRYFLKVANPGFFPRRTPVQILKEVRYRFRLLQRLVSFRSAFWAMTGVFIHLDDLSPKWMRLNPRVAEGMSKATQRMLSLQPALAEPGHLEWLLKIMEFLADSVSRYVHWEGIRAKSAGFIASLFVEFLTSEGLLTLLHKLGPDELFKAVSYNAYFEKWYLLDKGELPNSSHSHIMPEAWRHIEGLSFDQVTRYLPACMLDYPAAWDEGLVVGILEGRSIRSCLPYLTRAEAHLLSQLPLLQEVANNKTCVAIWKVKLLAAGADPRLVPYFYQYAGLQTDQMPFWETVVHFFAQNRGLVQPHYPLRHIFNFIAHKRQEEPGFSIKGRTWTALSRQAFAWYQNEVRIQNARLSAYSWAGASYRHWTSDAGNDELYEIVQLTNSGELQQEGLAMGHCVANYTSRCHQGTCSIWSLRKTAEENTHPLVTIEVDSQGRIVQAKARRNALPQEEHLAIIRQWAAREGIVIARV